jgi:hypothetical protein
LTALTQGHWARTGPLHHRSDDRDISRLLDDLADVVPGLPPISSVLPPLPEDFVPDCPYRGLQPFREDRRTLRQRPVRFVNLSEMDSGRSWLLLRW